MLSKEQTFFLSVLADHLNGRPTVPVSGLDWESVYDMAEKHRVSALFYAQCGAFLPPEAELRFLRDFGGAVSSYAARQKIASELDREFTLRKIPYVFVKGLAVAESYPQPELRTMGDIDIIVKVEDKERAHDLLLELGFDNTQKQDREWIYWKDSCEIELHHRLLYDEPANELSSLTLADRMWDHVQPVSGSSRCELSPEFHFLFLVMHLKKHMINCGAGFRQFMDLTVAAQKWPIDWSQMEKWLSDIGLLSFFKRSMALCRQYFELALPFAAENQTPESSEESIRQIFRNGVYGFDNEDNAENGLIAQMEANGGDSLLQRLRMCRKYFSPAAPELRELSFFQFFRILFPDYDYMRKKKNCRFIDGYPWLLPAGWFWRFICGGKYKIQRIFQIILFSRKKVRERREILKKMGL